MPGNAMATLAESMPLPMPIPSPCPHLGLWAPQSRGTLVVGEGRLQVPSSALRYSLSAQRLVRRLGLQALGGSGGWTLTFGCLNPLRPHLRLVVGN